MEREKEVSSRIAPRIASGIVPMYLENNRSTYQLKYQRLPKPHKHCSESILISNGGGRFRTSCGTTSAQNCDPVLHFVPRGSMSGQDLSLVLLESRWCIERYILNLVG